MRRNLVSPDSATPPNDSGIVVFDGPGGVVTKSGGALSAAGASQAKILTRVFLRG